MFRRTLRVFSGAVRSSKAPEPLLANLRHNMSFKAGKIRGSRRLGQEPSPPSLREQLALLRITEKRKQIKATIPSDVVAQKRDARHFSAEFRRVYYFREEDLEETSCRGRGPGGQATNRRMQTCVIRHKPSGVVVRFSKFPSLLMNRKCARYLLSMRVEQALFGEHSALAQQAAQEQRRLKRTQRRGDALLRLAAWEQRRAAVEAAAWDGNGGGANRLLLLHRSGRRRRGGRGAASGGGAVLDGSGAAAAAAAAGATVMMVPTATCVTPLMNPGDASVVLPDGREGAYDVLRERCLWEDVIPLDPALPPNELGAVSTTTALRLALPRYPLCDMDDDLALRLFSDSSQRRRRVTRQSLFEAPLCDAWWSLLEAAAARPPAPSPTEQAPLVAAAADVSVEAISNEADSTGAPTGPVGAATTNRSAAPISPGKMGLCFAPPPTAVRSVPPRWFLALFPSFASTGSGCDAGDGVGGGFIGPLSPAEIHARGEFSAASASSEAMRDELRRGFRLFFEIFGLQLLERADGQRAVPWDSGRSSGALGDVVGHLGKPKAASTVASSAATTARLNLRTLAARTITTPTAVPPPTSVEPPKTATTERNDVFSSMDSQQPPPSTESGGFLQMILRTFRSLFSGDRRAATEDTRASAAVAQPPSQPSTEVATAAVAGVKPPSEAANNLPAISAKMGVRLTDLLPQPHQQHQHQQQQRKKMPLSPITQSCSSKVPPATAKTQLPSEDRVIVPCPPMTTLTSPYLSSTAETPKIAATSTAMPEQGGDGGADFVIRRDGLNWLERRHRLSAPAAAVAWRGVFRCAVEFDPAVAAAMRHFMTKVPSAPSLIHGGGGDANSCANDLSGLWWECARP